MLTSLHSFADLLVQHVVDEQITVIALLAQVMLLCQRSLQFYL